MGTQTRRHAVLAAVAFCLTAAAVYGISIVRGNSRAEQTATATVRFDLPPAPEGSSNPPPLGPTASEIEASALSDDRLVEALDRLLRTDSEGVLCLPADPSAAVAVLRNDVEIAVCKDVPANRLLVSFRCTRSSAREAVRIANCLAELCAEHQRADAEATVHRARAEASLAVQRAGQEHERAKQQFERFLEGHFRDHEALAQRLPPPQVPSPPPPSPGERKAGDSKWAELNRQLQQLRQHLDALKRERTANHPEVQELTARVCELEGRLASISPPLPPPERPPTAAPTIERRSVVSDSAKDSQAVQAYRAEKEELDRATEGRERMIAVERQVFGRSPPPSPAVLSLADVGAAEAQAKSPPGFPMIALAAGISVALGVGLISTGMAVDLPLASAEDARMAVRAPIIGVLRTGQATRIVGRRRAAAFERFLWIVVGGTVIAACAALLTQVP